MTGIKARRSLAALLSLEAAAGGFAVVAALGKAATPPGFGPPGVEHVGFAPHYDGPALLAFLLPLTVLSGALLMSALRLALVPERVGPIVRACVVAQPVLLFLAGAWIVQGIWSPGPRSRHATASAVEAVLGIVLPVAGLACGAGIVWLERNWCFRGIRGRGHPAVSVAFAYLVACLAVGPVFAAGPSRGPEPWIPSFTLDRISNGFSAMRTAPVGPPSTGWRVSCAGPDRCLAPGGDTLG